ncbi:MAG: T9SS type A sorting domain-containing protein [Bacteroidetes bacterium]|nr:T9SS type A sorting domain-containing protein [Bacteroidota bacterium]
MKWCIFIAFALLSRFSLAQSPIAKQWDYRFGGDLYDYLNTFQQTTDGGYILGGYSSSGISGDKTQPSWGNLDFWIVKTDALGIKQWDKRFGGTGVDYLNAMEQTADGGYILGGNSDSGVGGDKTQPNRGAVDYWIIKTDSLGNKIWDKRYGGTDDEYLVSVLQTSDGGYIIGGYSGSGIGGDKTQINRGYNDYWIVRTDSIGTVLWDKDFGGTDYDFMTNLLIADDGGFLLGGSSTSPTGPDKTQNTWGATDVWLIKTDSLGNKIWDADYGGVDYDQLNSFCKSADGGYMLGCYSASGISGNKTQNTWGLGDVWLLKITDTGTIQWDKDFGGTDTEDGVGSVFQNSDGGYFVISNSFSDISGNKTENNLGFGQAWVIKTDSLGTLQWDKTIFTDPDQKIYPMMIPTGDGCYAIAESTYGDVAGDKTQPNRDATLSSTDFWIIRYCDTTAATVAVFSATDSICPGTCVDFTNLSSGASSYLWSFPGANITTSTDINPTGICYANPGTYDVSLIAMSAGGTDTLSIPGYITVFPFPQPQGIMQNGDTLSANLGATSYQWYHNGFIIPGATSYFYIATESGDYNVVATDDNNCEVEAAIFDVIAVVHPVSAGKRPGVKLFPNPAGELIFVSAEFNIESIAIFNVIGEKLFVEEFKQSEMKMKTEIGIHSLNSGIYWLSVNAGDNLFHLKFFKETGK